MRNIRGFMLVMVCLSLFLSACGVAEPPRPGIDVPLTRAQVQSLAPVPEVQAQNVQAEETPAPAVDLPTPIATEAPVGTDSPTSQPDVEQMPESAPAMLAIFEMPETISLYKVGTINLKLIGLPAGYYNIMVKMVIEQLAVEVLDAEPTQPGVQVAHGPLSTYAEVAENEVNEMGVLTYHVRNLEIAEGEDLTLFTLSVRGVFPEIFYAYIESITVASGSMLFPVMVDNEVLVPVIDNTAPATPPLVPQPTPTPAPGTENGANLPVVVPATLQQGVYYRILRGENLYRIGLRFGVSADQIAAVNGIRDVHFVPAGMILYIPVAAPIGSTAYYIRPGDTLYSICRGLNLRVVDVAALNGIMAPFNYIRADTWLMLAP